MHRLTKLLVLAEFAVLLAVPGTLRFLGNEGAAIENRARAEAPDLTARGLLDEATYAQLDAFFTDRLPLRDRAVEIGAWIDYRMFRDSPSEQVIIGRGEWLFFHQELNLPCESPLTADDVVRRVDLLDRLARASGRDFRFVIAPDKASIYRDQLGRVLPDQECNLEKNDRLRERMHALPVPVVSLWQDLEVAREEGLVYDARGTHWTDRGRVVALRSVVESLSGGAWFLDDVRELGPVPARNELTEMMGLTVTTPTEGFGVRRPGVTLQRHPRAGGREHLAFDRTTASALERPLVPGPVLFVRDSQFELMQQAEMLAPFFAEAFYAHWDIVSEPEVGSALGSSRVVVFETVERELWRRLGGARLARVLGRLVAEAPSRPLELDRRGTSGLRPSADGFVVAASAGSAPLSGPASDDDRLVVVPIRGEAVVRLVGSDGAVVETPWGDRDPPTSGGRAHLWIPAGVAPDDLVLEVDGGEAIGFPVALSLPRSRLSGPPTDGRTIS